MAASAAPGLLPGISLPWAVGFTLLLAALTLSTGAVNGVLVLLILWASRGRVATLQALQLSVLVKYMNPGLVSYDLLSGILLWLVILVAAVRVAVDARDRHWRRAVPVLAFAAIALPLSLAVSPAADISAMKLLTFSLVASTVLMGADQLDAREQARLQRWMLTLGMTVLALSALTLANPAVAYLRNGTGLQGVLNHPQSLGTFAAPYAALLLALVLLRRGAGPALLVATVACWALMFMTEARTAAFAGTLGVLAAAASRLWWGRRRGTETSRGAVLAWVATGLVMIAGAALLTDRVGDAVQGFLLKRSGADDVASALQASRGTGAAGQWSNFLESPVAGHGFGVYPDGSFPSGITRVWGIPISAPVEKGFVPTALLEETGLLGTTAFAVLAAVLWRRMAASRDPLRVAVFVGALGVNVGEAVILSPGGIGLHVWLLLALAATPAVEPRPHAATAGIPRSPRFPNVLR